MVAPFKQGGRHPKTQARVRMFYAATSFSPLSLFANGEQGAWYDPSDLSTLYQDAAGTTPVTADGDPVGLMLDKSGNGNHASQAVSAARPTYRTDGTLHWLEFDGVDDNLHATLNQAVVKTSPFWACLAATSTQTGTSRLLSLGLDDPLQILTQDDGYRMPASAGSSAANIGVKGRDTGTDIFTLGSLANGDYITRIGGQPVANQIDSMSALGGEEGVLVIGARASSGANPTIMDFSGGVLIQRVGGFEDVENYLASLAGVTL